MKHMTGNESKHNMRLRAHKLDRKMQNDYRHQFVTERAGESFTDALTRTREALQAWTHYRTLLAQMATCIPFCNEEQLFRLEAEMGEVRSIIVGLEDYAIVKRLATISMREQKEESAFHREASRKRTALMTDEDKAERDANVERMELVYRQTH